jgi:hypothetical protein
VGSTAFQVTTLYMAEAVMEMILNQWIYQRLFQIIILHQVNCGLIAARVTDFLFNPSRFSKKFMDDKIKEQYEERITSS